MASLTSDTLPKSVENSNFHIREFIKMIYWFGYELGSNKAFEMSIYAMKQSKLLQVAVQLGKNAFLSNQRELLPYLKLLHVIEQDLILKTELEYEITIIESLE